MHIHKPKICSVSGNVDKEGDVLSESVEVLPILQPIAVSMTAFQISKFKQKKTLINLNTIQQTYPIPCPPPRPPRPPLMEPPPPPIPNPLPCPPPNPPSNPPSSS
jgi:hypothetical protein